MLEGCPTNGVSNMHVAAGSEVPQPPNSDVGVRRFPALCGNGIADSGISSILPPYGLMMIKPELFSRRKSQIPSRPSTGIGFFTARESFRVCAFGEAVDGCEGFYPTHLSQNWEKGVGWSEVQGVEHGLYGVLGFLCDCDDSDEEFLGELWGDGLPFVYDVGGVLFRSFDDVESRYGFGNIN
nr:hypothetical protein KK1_030438 [Ipomoea batatas]